MDIEKRFEAIENRLSDVEKEKNGINIIVNVVSTKLDNIVKSLDKLSLQYEKNVVELNHRYDSIVERCDKIEKEVNEKTTEEQAKKYNSLVATVVTGVVSAIVAFIMANILK